MSIEEMKQALEALRKAMQGNLMFYEAMEAFTALRTAIEQAEKQEPVAWLSRRYVDNFPASGYETAQPTDYGAFPVYTHTQPQREFVGLTDEEIDQGLCRTPYALKTAEAWREGVRWAYHQLKEKNHG